MSEKDDKLNKGSFLYINDEEKAEWGYPDGYPKKNVQTTTLMEEQELAFALNDKVYSAQLTNAFEIIEGQTYIVNWDGTEYECVGVAIDEDKCGLGNLYLLKVGDDTGEPFSYTYNKTYVIGGFMALDTSSSHTISVKTTEGAVTPMTSAFLPQATQTTYGVVKQAAAITNVTAAPTAEEFNALLKSLRDAGILAHILNGQPK